MRRAADLFGDRVRAGLVHVEHGDLRAALGEQFRRCRTQSRAGPRHQSRYAFQIHVMSSLKIDGSVQDAKS